MPERTRRNSLASSKLAMIRSRDFSEALVPAETSSPTWALASTRTTLPLSVLPRPSHWGYRFGQNDRRERMSSEMPSRSRNTVSRYSAYSSEVSGESQQMPSSLLRLREETMGSKKFNLGVISVLVALLAVSIAFMGGCTRQPSTDFRDPRCDRTDSCYLV